MIPERFRSKIHFSSSGCWEWTAHRNKDGYGTYQLSKRVSAKAHRVAYEMMVGPIPEDLELDHLCRNRACVNPFHLELVTHRENILRGTSPTAIHAAKTHCIHGHEYTPENTISKISKSTGNLRRQCRECTRAYMKEYIPEWRKRRKDVALANRGPERVSA